MDLVVGVDGGGTRTRVALVRRDGRVLAEGESGPGNLQDIGPERFAENLRLAWRAAWRVLNEEPRPAASAFLGLAGVATEEDARLARDAARAVGLSVGRIDVEDDLRVAHAGALAGDPGIVLIVGTGSACYGRTSAGQTWRVGGFGWRLDDVGAASDLGRRAMIAALHESDGRGASTSLSARVLAALGLREVRELPRHAAHMSRLDVAGLAPFVTAAADEGDAVARALLEGGARELATCVRTVASRLALDAPCVSLVGAAARANPYTRLVCEATRAAVPGVRLVDPLLSPVRGAAMLALESEGVLDAQLRAQLGRA